MGKQIRLLPINEVSISHSGIDKRIEKPGIYSLPIHIYHSDCCIMPSVSSGDLVKISRSGEEYYAHSPYAPEKDDPYSEANNKKFTGHFSFGNAAHACVVGGSDFWKEFAVRPKKWNSWRSDNARIWRWNEIVRKRNNVITLDDVKHIKGMVERIRDDRLANALFTNGTPELTMIIQIGDVIVKIRPDITPIKEHPKRPGKFYLSDTVITDYKTIDDNVEWKCRKAIRDYGYDQKLANIAYVICKLFKVDYRSLSFTLIFQKKTKPYGITPIELDGEEIFFLMAKNLAAVKDFSQGMAPMGSWKGYTEGVVPYRMNSTELEKIKDRIRSGEYPNLDADLNIVAE